MVTIRFAFVSVMNGKLSLRLKKVSLSGSSCDTLKPGGLVDQSSTCGNTTLGHCTPKNWFQLPVGTELLDATSIRPFLPGSIHPYLS